MSVKSATNNNGIKPRANSVEQKAKTNEKLSLFAATMNKLPSEAI